MDVDTCSKRAQMFILEISWKLVCGQPCGPMPYMKGNVGFECRSTNRPAAHKLSEYMHAYWESRTRAGSAQQIRWRNHDAVVVAPISEIHGKAQGEAAFLSDFSCIFLLQF